MNSDIVESLGITAELSGTQLSGPALRAMAEELSVYDASAVLRALSRCRRELRGRLTLGEVIDRIEDGHPSAEQAWAIAVKAMDESATVVCTRQIIVAQSAVKDTWYAGDKVGARQAFVAAYTLAVDRARREGEPCHWFDSVGVDNAMREGPLLEAVRNGLISARDALQHLPNLERDTLLASPAVELPKLIDLAQRRLPKKEQS